MKLYSIESWKKGDGGTWSERKITENKNCAENKIYCRSYNAVIKIYNNGNNRIKLIRKAKRQTTE